MSGVDEYSTTPGSNTTINSIDIAEGCAPSRINNAIRQAMADTASNLAWLEKTTAYTAVRYDSVLCDTVTTGAFTLTLPASPSNGDWVRVGSSSSWASNNLTIGRNSQSIRGAGSDLTLSDAGNVSYLFVFDGTTWQYYVTADDTTGVVTSGTPVANDFARFTDASTIEGRSYAEVKADLSLEIGTDVQAYSAVLDATTASFTTADETKLDAIEASADVTDVTNVTAAGALMDSECTSLADVKALDQSVVTTASPTFVQPTVKAVIETRYAVTGTTPAIDPANGGIQTWTLSGNSTPTDSLGDGESVTLHIDDGTAYTITWTSLVGEWIGGTAPTLATTGYSVVELWKVNTTVYGAGLGDLS